jgi:hypothetical protein
LESIKDQKEKLLQTPVYREEKPCCNFEMSISKHLQPQLDIEKSGVEIRETKKICYLTESIDAAFLNAEIATVRATDRYLQSFDLTTTYIQTFIIADIQIEHHSVASVRGTKRVQSDKKNCFNSKQLPANQML